jgi:hypothetical protein
MGVLVPSSVGLVILVSPQAMSFHTVDSSRFTAPDVLGMSNGFEVMRVHTEPDATKMIQLQALYDRPERLLEGHSMWPPSMTPDADTAVATLVGAPDPDDAIIRSGDRSRVQAVDDARLGLQFTPSRSCWT